MPDSIIYLILIGHLITIGMWDERVKDRINLVSENKLSKVIMYFTWFLFMYLVWPLALGRIISKDKKG